MSSNAYDPVDTALGFLGGILSGADKLSRVAWLRSDRALAQVLGIEAVASESTLSRFFAPFTQPANDQLARLNRWAAGQLPSHPAGYTLDLDSWALLHEDGHQEGMNPGVIPDDRRFDVRHERGLHAGADIAGEDEAEQDEIKGEGQFQVTVHRSSSFL